MDGLLLTSFLIIQAVAAPNQANLVAARESSRAYYKQSGIERNVESYGRRVVSREVQAHIGTVAWISKSAIERKVTFGWSF